MKKEKYEIVTEYLECTATANASTANLGPGYDVFGLGLDILHDTVSIKIERKTTADKNNIKIIMNGDMCRSIPNDPESNSAGRVAKKIISDYNLYNYDCLIEIRKNIPPGYGMGSSAASAVATAVSLNALFGLNIEDTKVLDYSAEGELASAGVKHFDNVAGSLFGNFVIVKTRPKLEFIRIDSPNNLSMVICVPHIQVPKMKTEFSRKVIPQQVPLENMVHNVANACSVVAGFYLKDIEMICNSINDSVIEPARKKLIPGYEKIKERSLDAGAMAFTISGAGPSTVAFSDSSKKGLRISEVMEEEYDKINIKCKTFISKSGNGSKIVSLK